jgi:hypothetical protein
MALDPLHLAVLAERLLADTDRDEATCRTVINRMYYACHLTARDRIYGLDARTSPRPRPSHVAVVQGIRDRLDDEVADRLLALKRMREVADYVRDSEHPEVRSTFANAGASDWSELAAEALLVARDLLPLLRAMAVESAAEER